mgnify:CR=1 FL=1
MNSFIYEEDEIFDKGNFSLNTVGDSDEESSKKDPFRFLSNSITLQEYLMEQLYVLPLNKVKLKIGEFLIGNINERGYLDIKIEEVVKTLNVNINTVKEVLEIIQTFEPIGVGARDIKECLLIQLKQKGLINEVVEKLIKNYLEDLAKGRWQKISKELRLSLDEIKSYFNIIQGLEPIPGRNFVSTSVIQPYIEPDAYMEKVNGEYLIRLNDKVIPKVKINNYYCKLLTQTDIDKETINYLTNKIKSAIYLLKSIEYRQLTLYKVIEAIVTVQKEFFEYGLAGLKPLTLKDVSQRVGLHPSTVSRVIRKKYVSTPRGIFELKYFLDNNVGSDIPQTVKRIKEVLQDIIRNEDKKNPLTDQQISDILKKYGFNVTRRTVSKYRDELNIPSSTKRKYLSKV